ncbi:hypothetical protein Celal_4189 [Cellulophaga algicola DSM 14237]|uniref:DNA topoisomerase IV n=1 Tax=Cellulophaga algicola (strain DSM 14237 / IC166 / ACAM 630) TaxID=688270 RepID=E6XFF8_CELAD|nr:MULTISPECIES: hypothetical protein [Cellulophaga]ADV51431.1 hypothetical protein Celal_4189 [Cellulophaga algicola DSM 14237]
MRIRFFLGLIIGITLVSCYQPERDCKLFKTGEFTFEYMVDGEKKNSTFTRTEKYSIERYENKVDTATVRWLSDCEFILNPSDNQTPIHYKILSTTKDAYLFEYGVVGKKQKSKGTATKTN